MKTIHRFEQLAQHIVPQSRLLKMWQPAGGSAAQVTALELLRPDGQTQKLIVRQHSEWARNQNPHIAAVEFKLLHLLHSRRLAVPQPYHLEPAGELFSSPAIVLEYLAGETNYAPANVAGYVAQMATQLAGIHGITGTDYDLSYLPQQAQTLAERFGEPSATLDSASDEARIRRVLERVWPLPQRNPSVLLHGDFWPGNLLWHDGQLSGVIDWEDAKVGDPLEDFAISRFDLCFIFGREAMHEFTQRYLSETKIDTANLPYWDLCAALRAAPGIADWAAGWLELGRPDLTAERIEEAHRWFIEQAFAQIPHRIRRVQDTSPTTNSH